MRPLLLLGAALLCGGCALVPLYSEPLPARAERIEARTRDGWRLAMVRYRPQGAPRGLPVLLLHGISANARNIDLDERHSLARWLAEHGRETFTLTLRGCGDSDMPDPSQGRSYGYTIDTFAEEDLPAAVARIQELTGAPAIDFVGHSMGGLIGYIYLARGGQGFHSAITLGAPARFAWGANVGWALSEIDKTISDRIEQTSVDVPFFAHATMPFHGRVVGPMDYVLYNPENVSKATWRRFLAVGLGTISGGVLRQFGLWMREEKMLSADGQIDYTELLEEVRVPVLVVCGKADHIAPGPAARAGFDALGGPKEFFVAGQENGFEHDYGHEDLLIGERASEELWPRLLQFLERQPAAATPSLEPRADSF